jgi:hypothetical protein
MGILQEQPTLDATNEAMRSSTAAEHGKMVDLNVDSAA